MRYLNLIDRPGILSSAKKHGFNGNHVCEAMQEAAGVRGLRDIGDYVLLSLARGMFDYEERSMSASWR